MNSLSYIIVDDKKEDISSVHKAIKLLQKEQLLTGTLTYSGGFSNSIEASDFVNRKNVDLIILDIEMPTENGFEFINRLELSGRLPLIILMSLFHNKYAVSSLNYFVRKNVFAFIGKPIDKQKLHEALETSFSRKDELMRIQGLKANSISSLTVTRIDIQKYRGHITTSEKTGDISLSSVMHIEMEDHRLQFYVWDDFNGEVSKASYISWQYTMRQLEKILPVQFIRISKSVFLNMDFVVQREEYTLQMIDNNRFEIPRSSQKEFDEKHKLYSYLYRSGN